MFVHKNFVVLVEFHVMNMLNNIFLMQISKKNYNSKRYEIKMIYIYIEKIKKFKLHKLEYS